MPRDEINRGKKFSESRRANLEACYGPPHEWAFIRKGFDPLGKHTKSGYLVKHYAVLRCIAHPEEGETIAGMEEAKRYGAVAVRRPKAGRPRKYRTELA
jgi:hypothetical protein